MQSLGAVLKEARRRRGLRVKDVAAQTQAGISPSYLSCIENDLRHPSEDLLLELAKLLGLDGLELYRQLVRAKAPTSIRDQIFEPAAGNARFDSLKELSLDELVEQASSAIEARRHAEHLQLELSRLHRRVAGGESAAERWDRDAARYRFVAEKLTVSAQLSLDGDAIVHRHFIGLTPRPGQRPVVSLQHTAQHTRLPGRPEDRGFKLLEKPEDVPVEVEHTQLSPQRSLVRLVFPDGLRHEDGKDRRLSYSFRTHLEGAYRMEAAGDNTEEAARGPAHMILLVDKPCEEFEVDVHFPQYYVPREIEAWAGTQELFEADDNLIDEGVCQSWELRTDADYRVSLRVRRPHIGTRFGILWQPLDSTDFALVEQRLMKECES